MYAITRALIERVCRYSNDPDVLFRFRSITIADVAANRTLLPEEMPGELLIHDRDIGLLALIALIEVAAFQQRLAHGVPIPGRYAVHERLHVLAVFGLI